MQLQLKLLNQECVGVGSGMGVGGGVTTCLNFS
jgi:hypothetical protein